MLLLKFIKCKNSTHVVIKLVILQFFLSKPVKEAQVFGNFAVLWTVQKYVGIFCVAKSHTDYKFLLASAESYYFWLKIVHNVWFRKNSFSIQTDDAGIYSTMQGRNFFSV